MRYLDVYMAIIKKSSDNPLLTIGTTNSIEGSKVETKIPSTTVHLFFDGTRNNRFNTEAARTDENLRKKDISYDNYFSNIALLFMALEETESRLKIYIEGAGSAHGDTDAMFGLGMAKGSTGRSDRIELAFSELSNKTKNMKQKDIILNIYGFSRGAAWARHFCDELKKNDDWKVAKINFVGIYDTVSSDGLLHYNDVEELGLDLGKKKHDINFIAHLTAQNDYRNHFPLTRIKRAVHDQIGFECSFPGAHSDIGGGYSELYKEIDTFLGFEDEQKNHNDEEYIDINWFMDKGYYSKEQITVKDKSALLGLISNKAKYASRDTEYHYQFILAEIMKDIAVSRGQYVIVSDGITDIENDIEKMHNIPLLKKFRDSAHRYVMSNYSKMGTGYEAPLLSQDEMRLIYNRYIHNSLDYGDIANGGTILSKRQDADGKLRFDRPERPEVTEGYANENT